MREEAGQRGGRRELMRSPRERKKTGKKQGKNINSRFSRLTSLAGCQDKRRRDENEGKLPSLNDAKEVGVPSLMQLPQRWWASGGGHGDYCGQGDHFGLGDHCYFAVFIFLHLSFLSDLVQWRVPIPV